MSCKFGINLNNCRSANNQLTQIGFPSRLSCTSCHLDEASLHAVERYKQGDNTERTRVIKWFKKMEIPTIGFETGAAFHTGFRCPILKETIVTPCSLEKCAHHIDYPWGANCLLAYTHQQGIETLSAEEIAYLYHIPIDTVKGMLDQAIAKLRTNAIDQKSSKDPIPKQFTYFITDRVCCVCESALEEEIPKSLYIESIGAVYCSKECRSQMHPLLVELEVRKGIPIDQILDWTFRHYKSLALAEQALGIPRWLATESCHRFLDKQIEDYFPATKTAKPRETRLIRRTWHPPPAIDQMIASVRPVSSTIMERYGPRQVQFLGLKRQLNHLIQHL